MAAPPAPPSRRKSGRLLVALVGGALLVLGVILAVLLIPASSTTKVSRTSIPSPTVGASQAGLTNPATYDHFSADFPSAPKQESVPGSFGPYHFTLYLLVARGSAGPVVIAEEDIDPALPSDQRQIATQTALKSITTTSGLTLAGPPTPTSFRSYPAYSADYLGGPSTSTAISFMPNGSQLFIMFGPKSTFDALEGTFQFTSTSR